MPRCERARCKRPVELEGLCRTHVTAELDALFSRFIRLRDAGICQRCSSTDNPQCSHHITRGRKGTAWDPENAVVHCAACHTLLTHNPVLHQEWIVGFLGTERWEALKDKAYGKLDPERGVRMLPERPDRHALLLWLRKEEQGWLASAGGVS